MSDTWAPDAERFNKTHAPAGSAAGGQFAAASGSSSAKGKDTRPTPSNQHPVGQGETGKRVSDLQERLNAGGFKPPLKADGIFGPKTLAAVKAFQAAHGLKVDGLVGPLTTAALRGGHPAAHHTTAHAPAKTAPVKTAHRASDLKYGHGSALWTYWTKGEGFAKWSGAVHKWTTLRDLLLKAGVPAISADGLTTNIIMAVMPGYMKLAHANTEHKAGRSGMAEQDVMDKPAPAASRAESVFSRIWELEDIRIVSRAQGDGSGRLVEAYAAVFNVPAEIHDQHGDYNEENDPGSFNRSIDHAARSARSPFRCIYNHGMTLQGTPSDRGSIPIGTPEEVRAETRGLLTRTRYNETSLADDVLEAIRSGGITAQSYTGRILRSSPELRRGEKYRPGRDGQYITVRRLELALREYGPTPFPAFSGAEILGVRMSTPGEFAPDPDEHDEALPQDEEPAAGDPLSRTDGDEHSARYHQHALFALRSKEARERAGLVW
jgi:HK97 family phage prohead protease